MSVKNAPRIYSEKYLIILLSLIGEGIWQTFYIMSRTPIDTSMLGFGVLGILFFYFSLYYRPMKLLDRMLSGLVSEISDAVFMFDASGSCIWANKNGYALVGNDTLKLDNITDKLKAMFGDSDSYVKSGSNQRVIGSGLDARYYTL